MVVTVVVMMVMAMMVVMMILMLVPVRLFSCHRLLRIPMFMLMIMMIVPMMIVIVIVVMIMLILRIQSFSCLMTLSKPAERHQPHNNSSYYEQTYLLHFYA